MRGILFFNLVTSKYKHLDYGHVSQGGYICRVAVWHFSLKNEFVLGAVLQSGYTFHKDLFMIHKKLSWTST